MPRTFSLRLLFAGLGVLSAVFALIGFCLPTGSPEGILATMLSSRSGALQRISHRSGWVLTLRGASLLPMLTVAKDIIQLNRLNIIEATITDEEIDLIGQFPDLQLLSFTRVPIDDQQLARLTRSKLAARLTHLTLCETAVRSLPPSIRKLRELQRLEIVRNPVQGGLDFLCALHHLNDLNLCATGIQSTQLIAASYALSNLEYLDISSTKVDDQIAVVIDTCVRLKQLNVSRTRVAHKTMHAVAGLKNLESFIFEGSSCLPCELGGLWRSPKLEAVFISGTILDARSFDKVGSAVHLRILNISGSQLGDAALKRIALLPQVEDLTLKGTAISDTGVMCLLRHAAQLNSLMISGAVVSDKIVSALCSREPMTLFLHNTRLTPSGFDRLKDHGHLVLVE